MCLPTLQYVHHTALLIIMNSAGLDFTACS